LYALPTDRRWIPSSWSSSSARPAAAPRGRSQVGLLWWVATATITTVALLSAVSSGGKLWRGLNHADRVYGALSPAERQRLPIDNTTVQSRVMDWFARYVLPGDRIYFQTPDFVINYLTLEQAVRYVGRFYLLPAVVVTDPTQATVVFSYAADPSALGLSFIAQRQLGGSGNWVSRVAPP
jgi:hypothetical protein